MTLQNSIYETLVSDEPTTINKLAGNLQASRPAVMQALRALEEEGLVSLAKEREGKSNRSVWMVRKVEVLRVEAPAEQMSRAQASSELVRVYQEIERLELEAAHYRDVLVSLSSGAGR